MTDKDKRLKSLERQIISLNFMLNYKPYSNLMSYEGRKTYENQLKMLSREYEELSKGE